MQILQHEAELHLVTGSCSDVAGHSAKVAGYSGIRAVEGGGTFASEISTACNYLGAWPGGARGPIVA